MLDETNDHIVVRDEEGNTVRLFRDDPQQSMPEWLAYPMKGRPDWETIVKPRLNAHVPGRCPQGEELTSYADSVRQRDYPLGLWAGSFYGWPSASSTGLMKMVTGIRCLRSNRRLCMGVKLGSIL